MEKEYKHPKLRRKLIGIYKNSLTKRDNSYYHVAVCFALELYGGFVDGELKWRRIPLATVLCILMLIEFVISMIAYPPQALRLYLERRYT